MADIPDVPSVSIGPFDNLTGDASLDAPVATFGPALDDPPDAVFLAGDGSAFMTGSTITVDGGLYAMILPSPKGG